MKPNVFVFGWYNHGNLGDECFKTSFHHLWPNISFKFGDCLPADINSYDALWIGGGSFLDQSLPGKRPITIPVAFIGVGVSVVHPDYVPLLNAAKIIVVRDEASQRRLGKGTAISDLVFVQEPNVVSKQERRLTVLLNEHMVPKSGGPEWKSLAWQLFSSELAKVCDHLSSRYEIHFIPMCTGDVDDRRAAAGVISRMTKPSSVCWNLNVADENEFKNAIAKSSLVLSLRYHGIIFSVLSGVRCIPLAAHDKIFDLCADLKMSFVPYYGFTDKSILEKINSNEERNYNEYLRDVREKWLAISPIVERELF